MDDSIEKRARVLCARATCGQCSTSDTSSSTSRPISCGQWGRDFLGDGTMGVAGTHSPPINIKARRSERPLTTQAYFTSHDDTGDSRHRTVARWASLCRRCVGVSRRSDVAPSDPLAGGGARGPRGRRAARARAAAGPAGVVTCGPSPPRRARPRCRVIKYAAWSWAWYILSYRNKNVLNLTVRASSGNLTSIAS